MRTYNCLKKANIQTVADLVQTDRGRPDEHPQLRAEVAGRGAGQLASFGLTLAGGSLDTSGVPAGRRRGRHRCWTTRNRMRHRVRGRKLGLPSDQRMALLKGLVRAMIEYGEI